MSIELKIKFNRLLNARGRYFGNIKSQITEWSNSTCCDVQLKTGCFTKIPIFSNVCFWDLFIVIANAAIIGNWLLWKLNGKILPEYVKFIRGIKILLKLRNQ
jgi:hypothetical protein